MARGKTHILEVWGDFACFSRPELKVERWSYPCPTPSAARGIFDAIYCKGWNRKTGDSQFYWQVEKIELLSMPSYIALRRNEVKDKIDIGTKKNPTKNVESWMQGESAPKPIWADADKSYTGSDTSGRTQRQTMALRNPRYRLFAYVVPRNRYKERIKAFDEQFIRRAQNGKCFQQPYLGCREFITFFRYMDSIEDQPVPVDFSQDLGFMLYDVFDLSEINSYNSKAKISLFEASVKEGVLHVPPYESEKVLKQIMRGVHNA